MINLGRSFLIPYCSVLRIVAKAIIIINRIKNILAKSRVVVQPICATRTILGLKPISRNSF